MTELPKALGKEPLVDAVFEVRFGGNPQLADILPGVLFGQFEQKPVIERLPAHEIPQPVRASDKNLFYTPLLRLDLGQFTVSVGDRNVVIGCKLPYPKWPTFKSTILDIIGRIAKAGVVGAVERYSIKYINLIEAPTVAEQIGKIEMSIQLGDFEVTKDHISLQVHRKEGDVVHIVSVVTNAQARMASGNIISGVVVDIDSIRNAEFPDLVSFVAELDHGAESLRQANKEKFFSCLTGEAVEEMEPKYD
jgi:uncharacterized protein (TIGR04255 family)